MYAALFADAFYGLLRIGEVSAGSHVILARNVHVGQNKNKLLFILETSKTHNKGDKLQMVKITCTPTREGVSPNPLYCPFAITKQYLIHRPAAVTDNEQFFVFSDRMPVTPQHVRKMFAKVLLAAKLNPHAYLFHGLRAGRASGLLKLGLSVEMIKKIGRWKSNAVFTYLRN